MKVRRIFVSALLLVLAFTLVGGAVLAQDGKVLVSAVSMVGGDLETIDPALAQVSSQIEIINQIFVGLTHQNEVTASNEAGVATWDVSEDGTVYTFNITPEISWVNYNAETGEVEQVMDEDGNPRYVTAADFVYGWQRTLTPETGGAYAYVLSSYVVNGNEVLAGEADPADLAVVAVDDYTLEVTTPEAVAFAPSIYGLWMARAQPQWAIEEFGDLWTEPENINTYGPFALSEWAHDESITLVKNPFWAGTEQIPQPALDAVTFRFLDPAAQFAEYQAGTIDAINVPLEEIPRAEADPELSQQLTIGTNPCTYYVGFETTKSPTDNVHLRRALSFAIDRQSIVDNVTRGGQIAAQWFSRPGMSASPTLETHPDLGVQFDVERAQEELALALEDMGLASASELPPITLAYNDAAGHAPIMQAIQQMWAENLGVNAELQAIESTGYFSGLREDAPTAFRAGWCQDYSDANNFMYEVYHSSSEFNYTNFTSEEYDALVEQARVLTDEEERRELYAEANELLVDEIAAIAPIYWYTTVQMTRPEVERTYSITGNEYYFNWDVNR